MRLISRKIKSNLGKWGHVFKTLLITIAPLYVPIILIIIFGFNIQSILASILFVQIYVLVIQAEAMLRQETWSKTEYEPFFEISTDTSGDQFFMIIANCGHVPAYNFFIGIRDETSGTKPEYEFLEDRFRGTFQKLSHKTAKYTLVPNNEKIYRVAMNEEDFRSKKISLRLGYNNVLGDDHELEAVCFEGSEEFLIMHIPTEPGFLIKAYGDLMFLFRWQFKYRKMLRGYTRK